MFDVTKFCIQENFKTRVQLGNALSRVQWKSPSPKQILGPKKNHGSEEILGPQKCWV